MGKINLSLDDDLEGEFRAAVAKKYGARKGNIQDAAEDAFRAWIKKNA